MATQSFDKLNDIKVEFANYFSELNIPQSDIDRRCEIAFEWYEMWLFFVDVYENYLKYPGSMTESALTTTMQSEGLDRFEKYGVLDDQYLQERLMNQIGLIVGATIKNEGSERNTSNERGVSIAEDQANKMGGYLEYSDAVSKYNYKIWHTMEDELVRTDHALLDGAEIPVNGLFDVGGFSMRFPTDQYYGAPDIEVINCRCYLTYRY